MEVTDNIEPSPVSGEDLNIVTARTVYNTLPKINNSHDYTSETTIFAPITKGLNGNILQSDGSDEPKWKSLEQLFDDLSFATKEDVIKATMDALKEVYQFDYEIVNNLPNTGIKGKLYLLLNSGSESNNLFDKYMWIEETSSFEKLGVNSSITNFIPISISDGNLAVLNENGKISDSGLKFIVENGRLKLLYEE